MSLKQCCALGRCVATQDLKACSACSEVLYCCRDHQVEHFKQGGHKMVCPGRKTGLPLTFNECAQKANEYHTRKMWVACLPYYSAMLELTERSVGLFHDQVARILEAMATCYKMMSKFEEAAQCLQRALVIREIDAAGITSDPARRMVADKVVFTVMGILSELYVHGGNLVLAKELLQKTRDSAVEVFGENSFEHGRVLCALANCLDRNDESTLASETLMTAIAIPAYAESAAANEMLAAANAFFNLGIILQQSGDKETANRHFRKSLELKVKGGLPASHPDVVEVRDYITGKLVAEPRAVAAPTAAAAIVEENNNSSNEEKAQVIVTEESALPAAVSVESS